MLMSVKLNSIFNSEMKVYFITQVLKQCIIFKPMCPLHNWIKKDEITFIECLSRRVGQDRNCHWKSIYL